MDTPTAASSSSSEEQLRSQPHNDNFNEYQYHLFSQGIDSIFNRWAALTLAKQHHASGDDTEDLLNEFRDNVRDWVANDGDQLEYDEIVQYMTDVLTEDLGIDVLDGSIPSVSKHILLVFNQCKQNNFQEVAKLLTERKEVEVVLPTESEFVKMKEEEKKKLESVPIPMEDETTIAVEEQSNEPEVDEDGFQMVSKKKNTGRRK